MAGSYNVHGERIVDGNAGTLTALTFYNAGSDVERELTTTEILHVTDVIIIAETAGDVVLVAGAETPSNYIVSAGIAAGVPLVIHFNTPYICAADNTLKFSGSALNKSMCVVQGFVQEA